jgi:phenylalanyl-tRNA synthetase beta chain
LLLGGEVVGVLGEVSGPSRRKFDLRGPTVVAELKLAPLVKAAVLVPRYATLPAYPAIDRDLNLVVDEAVRWSDVAATVKSAGGELLASFGLNGEPFRDDKKIGPGKKSFVISLRFQSRDRTLTGVEVDKEVETIMAICRVKHGAALRA